MESLLLRPVLTNQFDHIADGESVLKLAGGLCLSQWRKHFKTNI